MGHFGRMPVRLAWFMVVWPGLLLNYFGQGALLLQPAGAPPILSSRSPLPRRCPASSCSRPRPIIASQATISGAFSITRQAVQLDLLPRVKILQTSADEHGQIYVPATNAIMLVAACAFVLASGSSSALSGAYGASVIGTMLITTILGAVAARVAWQWPAWRIAPCSGCSARRPRVRRRQRDQDPDRRLGAARARSRDVRGVRHLARRPVAAARRAPAPRRAARRTAEAARRLDARAGHGGVPGQPPGLRADGDAAQPRAQRRLPREDRHPAPRDPAQAAPGRRLAQLSRGNSARRAPRARALRLHGDAGRHASRWRAPRAAGFGSTRIAPTSSAGTWSARARATGSPASRCGCSPGCSAAARRRRSSSACRPGASWCSRPKSKSSQAAFAPSGASPRAPFRASPCPRPCR